MVQGGCLPRERPHGACVEDARAAGIPAIPGISAYSRGMSIARETVAFLAASIGHTLTISPRRVAFGVTCSCGYSSTKRRTLPLALEAAIHHQEVVIREFRATGRPWPVPKPADDTPTEPVFEGRPFAVA